MFSYEFVNHIFNGLLVNKSEIFVDLLMKRGVGKLPQSFFLVEVVRQTTKAPLLSASLITMSLRFFRLFSADYSSEERLENLVLRLKLSLLISWRHFLIKKSNDANCPSGGVQSAAFPYI